MFEISVQTDFSAAHNLRQYRGKCEQLHGHNWQVEAVFGGSTLDRAGMVVDFKIARRRLHDVLKQFDHRYLNKTAYFSAVNPTSEHLARFIFRELSKKIARAPYRLLRVSVWETPLSRATYFEELPSGDAPASILKEKTAGRKLRRR